MSDRTSIWKNTIEQSKQLKSPINIQQILSKDEIEMAHTLIKEIIHRFIDKGEHHIGLKTYVNQNLDHFVIRRMVENPPQKEQTLEEWCRFIFQEEKFGMVLNTIEGYSNAFAELAATIVKPLLKEAGLPLEGLSFLFFMGNYGFTPFGIHKEARGEEGILFHLGPGKKTFYTWDSPEYNSIEHYTEAMRNIDEMLPTSQTYDLVSGDAMFIPHQVFHIANSSEFSLSFVMDYINPSTDRFENLLLQEAAKEELYMKNGYQTPVQSDHTFNIETSGIIEKLDIAYKRRVLTLKSNAGILRKSQTVRYDLPNGIVKIQGKPIFPLYCDQQGDKQILIFARGHRFLKPYHKNISEIIDQLNQGEVLTIQDLSAALTPEWDMVEVLSIVGDLLSIEAIDIQ